MLRILFKLAILGVIIFAGLQTGASIWRFYAFRDSVRQEAMFPGQRTESEIANRVLARAEELGVPIDPWDIIVQFEGNLTVISAVYEDSIPLVPRFYSYSHIYDASATEDRRPVDMPR
jgi:hypothetical protein